MEKKAKYIISGKEVSEKDFKKKFSELKIAKEIIEAHMISLENQDSKKERGSARYSDAFDKKTNKKYEYIVTSFENEAIFEIREK